MMHAPGFWWRREKSLAALCLAPFSWIYSAVATRRSRKPGADAGLPIICIGNFTAGGAGKTPTAIAICRLLKEAGETPFVLSRGYGGLEAGPLLVDPLVHKAGDVGDEPLLLCRHAPVVVARDRVAGAALCKAHGATVVVMDDGMQNPALVKTFTLAVVDGQTGIGNGFAIPAGPLRMAMPNQWPLADAVMIIGAGDAGERFAYEAKNHGKPVFKAELRPSPEISEYLKGRKVLAFAGIGRPEKFFETLRALGASIINKSAFPDHHPFTTTELDALSVEARSKDLLLVTTEKDLARISTQPASNIVALPVELEVNEGEISAILKTALALHREPEKSHING